MDMEEMEITIPRDGTLQVRTRGFSGSRCLAATKEVEDAAGVLVERNMSPEYFLQELGEMVPQTFSEVRAGRNKG